MNEASRCRIRLLAGIIPERSQVSGQALPYVGLAVDPRLQALRHGPLAHPQHDPSAIARGLHLICDLVGVAVEVPQLHRGPRVSSQVDKVPTVLVPLDHFHVAVEVGTVVDLEASSAAGDLAHEAHDGRVIAHRGRLPQEASCVAISNHGQKSRPTKLCSKIKGTIHPLLANWQTPIVLTRAHARVHARVQLLNGGKNKGLCKDNGSLPICPTSPTTRTTSAEEVPDSVSCRQNCNARNKGSIEEVPRTADRLLTARTAESQTTWRLRPIRNALSGAIGRRA
jgi:hypothetical protein